jgi:NADPH-dependent 2,4-dienoyl-CoA reductase/sulfur reductase-like enzyme
MRLLIIGGSDAGISAALRARELDPAVEVHIILADEYPNFSICGLPFYLSGEISDWRTLAHRSRAAIEGTGIKLHLNTEAIAIDVNRKHVITRSPDNQTRQHAYDRLVIATGATPMRPTVPGADLPDVFVLHTMDECFALHRRLETSPRSAVIVGGGYIGLEMADALRHRNITVTLIEQLPAVMRSVDPPVAVRVEALLREQAVSIKTRTRVTAITAASDHLSVRCADASTTNCDFVLMVVGVRPLSELAQACGIHTNEHGAIQVDRGMRTNLPDIFAAGDCVATWHRLLGRDLYMPLGTTSHKQGRVAGENALGGNCSFAGSLGTQSVKLFDRVVAGTGVREEDARSYGFDPLATEITTYDHKVYYPGATEMIVRIIGDAPSGRLLGCQIFGAYGKEVSKRIDTIATALHHRMSVADLSELDLSYTPPLSAPWDPIQTAAQAWSAARRARQPRQL